MPVTDAESRLESKQETFVRIPLADHSVDYNEWHAIELALVGVFGGLAFAVGVLWASPSLVFAGLMFGMVVGAGAVVLPAPRVDSQTIAQMGQASVALETWYFVVAFVGFWLAGAGLGGLIL